MIVAFTFFYISNLGYSYYKTGIEERFFHPNNTILKPSGSWGHGFGIIGSFSMLLGVGLYIARKRMRSLSRAGILKHWLEFHIFLCTLGPVLVMFHTSFKIGGLVAISFWSMVAVFLSGIIGRFIYIQIPRTIEGRELSLTEIRDLQSGISETLKKNYNIDLPYDNSISLQKVKMLIKDKNLTKSENKQVLKLVRSEISLNKRIGRLMLMQNLFRYWHVAHLPFAIVMLIIMIIHVTVTIVFGYRWIL